MANGQNQGLLGGVFSTTDIPGARQQFRLGLVDRAVGTFGGQSNIGKSAALAGSLLGQAGADVFGGTSPQVERQKAIQRVQQQVSETGLDPRTDPEFFDVTAELFEQEGLPDLAQQTRLQQIQLTPEQEPQEMVVSVEGGTPRARAFEERLGIRIPEGEVHRLNFSGRTLSDQTRLSGSNRGTQTEREIERLRARGYSREDAEDIAYGYVSPVTDPLTGQTELISLTDRPSRPVTSQPRAPQTTEEAPEPARGERQMSEEEQGIIRGNLEVGLIPWLQEGVSRTFGQFFDSANNPSVTEARTKLRQAKQQLILALSSSSRPPVIEQERIEGNLPSLGPLESPERARVQLETLVGDLMIQRQADLEAIRNEELNPKLRRELQERVNAVERMIRLVDPSRLNGGQRDRGRQQDTRATPRGDEEATISVREAEAVLPQNSQLGSWDVEEGGWEVVRDGEVIGHIKPDEN